MKDNQQEWNVSEDFPEAGPGQGYNEPLRTEQSVLSMGCACFVILFILVILILLNTGWSDGLRGSWW